MGGRSVKAAPVIGFEFAQSLEVAASFLSPGDRTPLSDTAGPHVRPYRPLSQNHSIVAEGVAAAMRAP